MTPQDLEGSLTTDFPEHRTVFSAGHSDRIVQQSLAIEKLECTYELWVSIFVLRAQEALAHVYPSNEKLWLQEVRQLQTAFETARQKAEAARSEAKGDSGQGATPDNEKKRETKALDSQQLQQIWSKALNASLLPALRGWFEPHLKAIAAKNYIKRQVIQLKKDVPKPIFGSRKSAKSDPHRTTMPDSVAEFAQLGQALPDHVQEAGSIEQFMLPWLGVISHDQIRSRPVGIFPGEFVFGQPVTPNNEVTIKQRNASKRYTSFEEVMDRTAELDNQFESSWSTEFSEGSSTTHSQSTSFSGGLSVNAQIKVVNVGVNFQASTTSALTNSENMQRSRSEEQTRKVAQRLKDQHTITFKEGEEFEEEYTTTRVLSNYNHNVPVTFNFFKTYRKEQMTLERTGARMCLALPVTDPLQEARTRLNKHIDIEQRITLNNSCPLPMRPGVISTVHVLENDRHMIGEERGGGFISVNNYGQQLIPMSATVTLLGATKALNSDGSDTEEMDADDFSAEGGEMDTAVFDFGRTDADSRVRINVLYPEETGPGWWTKNIRVRIDVEYISTLTVTQTYRDCMNTAREAMQTKLSAQNVSQFLSRLVAEERQECFRKLNTEYGLFDLGQQEGLDKYGYFDFEDAVIEFYPWWGTARAEQWRRKTMGYFSELSLETQGQVTIPDRLFSPKAMVYLPIQTGREKDALNWFFSQMMGQFLGNPELPDLNLDACIDEFTTTRDTEFAAINQSTATSDELMSPKDVVPTPRGSDTWQNNWEKPQQKTKILGQWSIDLPTDGTHIETMLSKHGVTDVHATTSLVQDHALTEAEIETATRNNALRTAVEANPNAEHEVNVNLGPSEG